LEQLAFSDQILKKPWTALPLKNWDEMKIAPEIGYRICLSSPELTDIPNLFFLRHETMGL
jgi:response regulator RpfG family c-di-GMP phosphodiesterase